MLGTELMSSRRASAPHSAISLALGFLQKRTQQLYSKSQVLQYQILWQALILYAKVTKHIYLISMQLLLSLRAVIKWLGRWRSLQSPWRLSLITGRWKERTNSTGFFSDLHTHSFYSCRLWGRELRPVSISLLATSRYNMALGSTVHYILKLPQ